MEQSMMNPVEMSRGISEYGFMIVASGCFLFTSITTIFLFYRWHSKILGSIIDVSQRSQKDILESLRDLLQSTKELLYSLKEYNRLLEEQAERQKEQSRILEEIRLKLPFIP